MLKKGTIIYLEVFKIGGITKMLKEEIIKLIEDMKCKLLVKVIGSDKEFKVNVSKSDEFTSTDYKIFVNPFLDYTKDLDEETLDFWTGKRYFDDLFSVMENTKWKWEITE